MSESQCLLTINAGSSSIKFALFESSGEPQRTISGQLERIGTPDSAIAWRTQEQSDWQRQPLGAITSEAAVESFVRWLDAQVGLRSDSCGRAPGRSWRPDVLAADAGDAGGHCRVGPTQPARSEAPAGRNRTDRGFFAAPVQRAAGALLRHRVSSRPATRVEDFAGAPPLRGPGSAALRLSRTLVHISAERDRTTRRSGGFARPHHPAHLGSGASMAAVRDGRSIDTTMAFTPTAGLVMATRSGDLDPGFLLYLMRTERAGADAIDELVNSQSGLLGISETSPDMRDLLEREKSDPRAAEAILVFCYQAKKWIGAGCRVGRRRSAGLQRRNRRELGPCPRPHLRGARVFGRAA